jgi:hypothetical protein
MALIRWEPFREVESLQREMNRLFESLTPSEKGDLWQNFKWPHKLQKTFADKENGETYWRDFLAKAIAATLKAEQALENLEKYDGWYRGKRHRH